MCQKGRLRRLTSASDAACRQWGGNSELMTTEIQQRSGVDWDEARRSALLTDIVQGTLGIQAACDQHGLALEQIHDWLRLFRRSALLAFDEQLKQNLVNQGLSAEAIRGAEFAGSLADISITDLIQTIHMAGKDATIGVTAEGLDSQIWCTAGAIVDAESGRLTGRAAVYRILSFDRGQFLADLRPTRRQRSIQASTQQLVLEAVHRKDELARLWPALGGANRRYRVVPGETKRTSVRPSELSVLALVDGTRSLRDMLRQSDLGDLETLTILQQLVSSEQLVEAGVSVEVEDSISPLSAVAHKSSLASFVPLATTHRPHSRPNLRWIASGCCAVAALSALLWSGALPGAPRVQVVPEPKPAAPAASPPVASTYSVATHIEPSLAEVLLDGHRVATSHVETVLPRDGRTHEMRISAAGYVPMIVLFVDTAPPSEIRLEALPPSRPAAAAPAPTTATAKKPSPAHHDRAAPFEREAPAPDQRIARDAPPPHPQGSALNDPGGREPGPHAPVVEREVPKIQVIE